MATKKVLVGEIGPNGIIVPTPWVPGDTLEDQDGNPIATGAGGGQFLGQDFGGIAVTPGATLAIGSFVWPVGTKDMDIKATMNLAGTAGANILWVGRAWIDLVTGGNQFESLYPVVGGVTQVVQATVTPPSLVYWQSGLTVNITTFTPGTRNIILTGFNPLGSTYVMYVKLVYRG